MPLSIDSNDRELIGKYGIVKIQISLSPIPRHLLALADRKYENTQKPDLVKEKPKPIKDKETSKPSLKQGTLDCS